MGFGEGRGSRASSLRPRPSGLVPPASSLWPRDAFGFLCGDEWGYMQTNTPHDACWSPSCIARLRSYLKAEYRTTAKLNEQWGTAYASVDGAGHAAEHALRQLRHALAPRRRAFPHGPLRDPLPWVRQPRTRLRRAGGPLRGPRGAVRSGHRSLGGEALRGAAPQGGGPPRRARLQTASSRRDAPRNRPGARRRQGRLPSRHPPRRHAARRPLGPLPGGEPRCAEGRRAVRRPALPERAPGRLDPHLHRRSHEGRPEGRGTRGEAKPKEPESSGLVPLASPLWPRRIGAGLDWSSSFSRSCSCSCSSVLTLTPPADDYEHEQEHEKRPGRFPIAGGQTGAPIFILTSPSRSVIMRSLGRRFGVPEHMLTRDQAAEILRSRSRRTALSFLVAPRSGATRKETHPSTAARPPYGGSGISRLVSRRNEKPRRAGDPSSTVANLGCSLTRARRRAQRLGRILAGCR